MSNRDGADLSAWERAVLADLEEAASAEDPRLHLRLQGGARRVPSLRWGGLPGLQSAALGVLLTVVGLALVVLSLSVALVLGIAGAVLTSIGLAFTLSAVGRRVSKRSA